MTGKARDDVGGFPSTRGSLILAARGDDPGRRRTALDELLRLYLPALRAYLLYRRRIDPQRAEDLLQAFVTRQILERALLCRYDAARGRFRSFLVKSLQNYVFDHFKAGGPQVPVEQCEPAAEPDSPEFELEWSRQLLRETLCRMEQDCAAEGQAVRWELFQCRVVVPTLTGSGAFVSQSGRPVRLSLRRTGVQRELVTAKRQFQRTLRALICETEHLRSNEEIDAEIAELCISVRRAGPLDMHWDRSLIAGPHGQGAAFRNLDESNGSSLASLMDTQATREGNWHTADLGDLLRDCLAMAAADYLYAPARRAREFSADSPSEHAAVAMPLGTLFRAAAPPLGLLIAVKRHARRLANPRCPATCRSTFITASTSSALRRRWSGLASRSANRTPACYGRPSNNWRPSPGSTRGSADCLAMPCCACRKFWRSIFC